MKDQHSSGSLPGQDEFEKVQLVQAIAAGDREAEAVFARRYLSPVRIMLLARSRNPDLVPDLLQDVLIEAICGLRRGQLREAAKLTPFVMGIARNVLNNHFRQAMRQPESLELPDELPDLSLPDFSSTASHAENDRRAAMVLNALSRLERTDRAILQMTLVDGLKPGVIAERLQLSSEVVRQRKVRATRRVMDFVLGSSQSKSQKPSAAHFIRGRRP